MQEKNFKVGDKLVKINANLGDKIKNGQIVTVIKHPQGHSTFTVMIDDVNWWVNDPSKYENALFYNSPLCKALR